MHGRHVHERSSDEAPKSRLYAVLALTAGYLVAEVVGGVITGSLALLADAGHMFTDVFGLAMSVAAIKLGEKPPNAKKTYGYRRAEILAAMVNGVLMILVGLGILYEAYRRFRYPPEILGGWMLGVAACGLLVNLLSAWLLHGGAVHSINVRGAYLEVISDLLGSAGAIAAAAVILFTGWKLADPVVSAGIGLFILPRAWNLAAESVNILLEGAPAGLDFRTLRCELEELPGVRRVHDLHAWSITSGRNALSAHLVVDDAGANDSLLIQAQRLLKDRFQIDHATLQIESLDFDPSLENERHA